MSEHRNNVANAVSGTPGTGTITLASAVTGSQSFATAYGANATVDVFITDGTAWEVARNCTYTHSGTTLSRGTLEASSTGSAISLTSAAVVRCAMPASTGTALDLQLARGTVIVRNDGSTTTSLSASTFTKMTSINSEELDSLGWWDNANAKFLPTRAGNYLCVMGIQINMNIAPVLTTAATVSVIASFRKNGSDYTHAARGWVTQDSTLAAKNVGVSGSSIISFNGSSDYVEPFGWQNDSSSRSSLAGAERQFFMATYLGDS